jgi:tetratricopeptide (TPR) repeat protein
MRSHPVDYQSSLAREMMFNGIDALQRGHAAEAQQLLSTAAKASANDQRIRAELARAMAQNGQLTAAVTEMEEAVRLSGGEAAYHVELGELYLRTGQLEQARRQAEAALENNRRLASAWALKGRAEKDLGEIDAAQISLSRALAHDPELFDSRYQLALLYLQAQQPQRALSVLENMNQQSGSAEVNPEYVLLRGTALAQVGQLDMAAEVLAKGADCPLPSPEILLELGRVQTLRSDIANARRTLARGKQLFADRPEFQRQLDQLPADGIETVRAGTW